jgi:hypothetical protein
LRVRVRASQSRAVPRNLLPSPSPRLAPLASPAMSTHSIVADTARSTPANACSRSPSCASGTPMRATLGSMVQKGKLAACASDLRASALKSVDLPTLGRPMMPTRTLVRVRVRGRVRVGVGWAAR